LAINILFTTNLTTDEHRIIHRNIFLFISEPAQDTEGSWLNGIKTDVFKYFHLKVDYFAYFEVIQETWFLLKSIGPLSDIIGVEDRNKILILSMVIFQAKFQTLQ